MKTETAQFHGVLITYQRDHDLRHFLEVLEKQTASLDSLVVVDNAADVATAQIVEVASGAIRYIGRPTNMGPAGGIDAGIEDVLSFAKDEDWVVLLDDDDPPQRDDCLEIMRSLLVAIGAGDASCAGLGMWGASLNKWTGRVRAASGHQPEQVDYLPGSALPHYSVSVLRRTGSPSPAMFFGFDDLELGLRVRDLGLHLYSTGQAREHGLGHMVEGRRASARAEAPTWRRYYSLRNLIIVLRAHGATRGALYRTLVGGIAKPMVNIARSPRIGLANLTLNLRAIRDGWLGRAGKTIDPTGLPVARRNAAPR